VVPKVGGEREERRVNSERLGYYAALGRRLDFISLRYSEIDIK
jgi:hypothetical protein